MKKAAIFVASAALILSLAACGNRDNKNQGASNGSGTANNGMTSRGDCPSLK